MKGRIAALAAVLSLFAAGSALAASPIQLALFDPAQIVKDDQSVGILRIDLIYGKNANVTGLDLGLVNHTTGNQGAIRSMISTPSSSESIPTCTCIPHVVPDRAASPNSSTMAS